MYYIILAALITAMVAGFIIYIGKLETEYGRIVRQKDSSRESLLELIQCLCTMLESTIGMSDYSCSIMEDCPMINCEENYMQGTQTIRETNRKARTIIEACIQKGFYKRDTDLAEFNERIAGKKKDSMTITAKGSGTPS